ncbi:TonB-dependent receptor [Undibacterium sp. Ji50W]|uniref:TonB-dependent receptor n=1 Tax=Undibacterium sp. Ji50W TaxID=3413041 RepID=UPI003BF348AF
MKPAPRSGNSRTSHNTHTSQHRKPQSSLLPHVCGMSLIAMAVSSAYAQTTPTTDTSKKTEDDVNTIVVTGKALALNKAISLKRDFNTIADGISSDEIGSIPDFGLGEAVQRVAGVSMILNNGRGEAQFMTLRGLNPDYNSLTIDGITFPGTETTRRTVSLDVLPSSFSKQVNIYKSLNADMDGNAIGGTTNLVTRSGLDKRGFHISGRADVSQWRALEKSDSKPSGQAEMTISNTFGEDNQFGVLVSTGYYKRQSSSLLTSLDSYSYFPTTGSQTNAAKINQTTGSVDGSIAFPDRERWLTYDNNRERKSLFARFDFDNRENLSAHLSAGAFEHVNTEDRRSQWLQNATAATSPVNIISATEGSVGVGQSQTDYSAFTQTRRISYVEGGFSYMPAKDSVIEAVVNSALGSYRQESQLYTFVSANSASLAYNYSFIPGQMPVLTPVNRAYLQDGKNFTQTENTRNDEQSKNRSVVAKISFSKNLDEGSSGWGFKTGLQSRKLTQNYNFDEVSKYIPATGVSIPLSAVGASTVAITPYSSNGQTLLLPDPANGQAYLGANPGKYILSSATMITNSTQKDFNIKEDVNAAYAMTAYRARNWSATAGLRYEETRLDIDTYVPAPLNQTTVFAPSALHSSYAKALPSLNLIYDFSDSLKLRTAYNKSLGRPTYADLAQNSNSVSGTTISITQANPNLVARSANNFNASLEWYPSNTSMISAGVFRKDIDNEIAKLTRTENVTIAGTIYQSNITQAQNVGSASVTGLELQLVNTKFSSLPAPFNQFGASVNYTIMDMNPSAVTMQNKTQRQMPALLESAKSTANASLLWGNGAISAQLSYNWTGPTLITLSTTNAAQDVYYKAFGTFDSQIKYAYSKQLAIVMQAKNLLNARPGRTTGLQQQLLQQEFDNGRALFLGLTYAM